MNAYLKHISLLGTIILAAASPAAGAPEEPQPSQAAPQAKAVKKLSFSSTIARAGDMYEISIREFPAGGEAAKIFGKDGEWANAVILSPTLSRQVSIYRLEGAQADALRDGAGAGAEQAAGGPTLKILLQGAVIADAKHVSSVLRARLAVRAAFFGIKEAHGMPMEELLAEADAGVPEARLVAVLKSSSIPRQQDAPDAARAAGYLKDLLEGDAAFASITLALLPDIFAPDAPESPALEASALKALERLAESGDFTMAPKILLNADAIAGLGNSMTGAIEKYLLSAMRSDPIAGEGAASRAMELISTEISDPDFSTEPHSSALARKVLDAYMETNAKKPAAPIAAFFALVQLEDGVPPENAKKAAEAVRNSEIKSLYTDMLLAFALSKTGTDAEEAEAMSADLARRFAAAGATQPKAAIEFAVRHMRAELALFAASLWPTKESAEIVLPLAGAQPEKFAKFAEKLLKNGVSMKDIAAAREGQNGAPYEKCLSAKTDAEKAEALSDMLRYLSSPRGKTDYETQAYAIFCLSTGALSEKNPEKALRLAEKAAKTLGEWELKQLEEYLTGELSITGELSLSNARKIKISDEKILSLLRKAIEANPSFDYLMESAAEKAASGDAAGARKCAERALEKLNERTPGKIILSGFGEGAQTAKVFFENSMDEDARKLLFGILESRKTSAVPMSPGAWEVLEVAAAFDAAGDYAGLAKFMNEAQKLADGEAAGEMLVAMRIKGVAGAPDEGRAAELAAATESQKSAYSISQIAEVMYAPEGNGRPSFLKDGDSERYMKLKTIAAKADPTTAIDLALKLAKDRKDPEKLRRADELISAAISSPSYMGESFREIYKLYALPGPMYDEAKAFKAAKAASTRRIDAEEALERMARHYITGKGVQKDEKTAVGILKSVAMRKPDSVASLVLVYCIDKNIGGIAEEEGAQAMRERLLKSAGKRTIDDAAHSFCQRHSWTKNRAPEDKEYAFRLLEELAEKGIRKKDALWTAYWFRVENKQYADPEFRNPEAAFGILERIRAEFDSDEARFQYAAHLIAGCGTEAAPEKAVKMLEEAVSENSSYAAESASLLAYAYSKGLGVAADPALADKWLQEYLSLGHNPCINPYRYGEVLPQDREWFKHLGRLSAEFESKKGGKAKGR